MRPFSEVSLYRNFKSQMMYKTKAKKGKFLSEKI